MKMMFFSGNPTRSQHSALSSRQSTLRVSDKASVGEAIVSSAVIST